MASGDHHDLAARRHGQDPKREPRLWTQGHWEATGPLWLPQVLKQGLSHQCTCISYIGEFVVEEFFCLQVVTYFSTLRADLEDYFKCMT